jgi:hypothetical protein
MPRVLAGLLCATCATAAPAGAAPSLSWSSPAQIDGQALSSVSCPSSSLCVAVDDAGDAVVSTDPGIAGRASWSQPFPIDPGKKLSSVSCPSSSLCVAVDDAGDAWVDTEPGRAGTIWQELGIDATHSLTGVSCASDSLCVAVDDEGRALVATVPTGGASAWRSRLVDPSLGPVSVSVSCTPTGLCVAVDAAGNSLASANATADVGGGPGSGATWSSTPIDTLRAPTSLSVSCAATGLCVAVDAAGYVLGSDDPAAAAPAWHEEVSVDPGTPLTSVACVSTGFCAAVDGSGRVLIGQVPPPVVTTGQASAIGRVSATLTGTVNPDDATLTDCHFDYGPSTAYGQTVACASTPTGGSPQPVSVQIPSGLQAGATYHFRLVAASAIGVAVGGDETFQTQSPVFVEPHPSIGGIPALGQRLTCKSGVSAGVIATGVALGYAWLRDLRTIAGATGSTYVVTGADVSHHLQCRVTATNAAGARTATSGFVTVPAGGLGTISETTVGPPRAGRDAVSVTLTCSHQAAGSCTIALRLTVTETLRGSRVIALAAAQRTSRRTITVGASTVRLSPGQRLTATVALNATGRRLLARRRRLAVRLSVSGTVVGAISASLQSTTVTLTQARVSSRKASSRHRRR